MAYGSEVREQALALLDWGMSYRKTAETMGIGKDTLMRWANPSYAEQRRAADLRSYHHKTEDRRCEHCGSLAKTRKEIR